MWVAAVGFTRVFDLALAPGLREDTAIVRAYLCTTSRGKGHSSKQGCTSYHPRAFCNQLTHTTH